MSVQDRYYSYLLEADISGAWSFLESLSDADRRAAKAWFERSKVGLLDQLWRDSHRLFGGNAQRQASTVAPWILALGPIALLGPATAARKIPWGRMWWVSDEAGLKYVVARLCEKDRAWAAKFVEEASAVRVGDNGHTVATVVRAVATHHELPCPQGDTFLEHWTAGVPEMNRGWNVETRSVERDPAAWLTTDPFMPDLLLRHLASGHCGSSDWLPETVPVLVERGAVERDDVVQQVLVQLTSPQRPASQKVLVQIVEALKLSADEVPGGISYLLGVIATSKGAVGKVLLPLALQSLADPDDLAELTAIIAGRSEKAQRTALFNALKSHDLQDRLGIDAVRDALEILASGDDAAFTLKVRGVLDALGGTASTSADLATEPEPTGLWEMAPTASGIAHPDWFHTRNPSWSNVVDSRSYGADARRSPLIDKVLAAMADHLFDEAGALSEITAVMGGARLSMSTTISVFRDLFLSGGLRQGYPLALATAEAASALTTTPASLADLLRLLSEFSVEIPLSHRPALPAALAAVASSAGNTKARAEARVLGARLAGVSLESYLAGLSGPAPSPEQVRQGLWGESAESTLAQTRLPRVDGALAKRLFDPQLAWWSHADVTGGFGSAEVNRDPAQTPGLAFCGPDLLVAAVVRNIIPSGVKKARKAVRELYDGRPPNYARPEVAIQALTYWAGRGVDPARFWELALSARTARAYQQGLEQGSLTQDEAQEVQRRLHDDDVIAYDGRGPRGEPVGVVLTVSLDSAAARLDFLRTLEVMLLAEQNAVVLATPVWADGTLDLDTLLERLRAAAGRPIGPLDLVQALHRLRPCDPDRVREVEELSRSGGSWQTARSLTTPVGKESWAVLELVRAWVAAGGLPPLDPKVTVDQTWSTHATVPVPWSMCAAAPAELRAGEWSVAQPGDVVRVARVFPLWPDRTLPELRRSGTYGAVFPAELSGRFERPLHDALVALLVRGIGDKDAASLASACRTIRRGKVDSALFTDAVVAAVDDGELKVGRLAQATHHVFQQGGLAQFWDASLAATAALAGRPGPVVRGLGQLADVLAAYAHEVPDPFVPAGLRAVAARGGASKFQQSVVSLLDALGQGGSR